MALLGGCGKSKVSENTRYAPSYAESNFKKIRVGMPVSDVVLLLGTPLLVRTQNWSECWCYQPASIMAAQSDRKQSQTVNHRVQEYDLSDTTTCLYFTKSGFVERIDGDGFGTELVGLSKDQVSARIGRPTRKYLTQYAVIYDYTLPAKSETYESRELFFDATNRVVSIVSETVYD